MGEQITDDHIERWEREAAELLALPEHHDAPLGSLIMAGRVRSLAEEVLRLREELEDKPPPVDVQLQASANRHLCGENEALRAMLARLEWVEDGCAICERRRSGGHDDDCDLEALLVEP